MFAAQATIGVVNDLCDQQRDSLSKQWKPLVNGGLRESTARTIAVVGCSVASLGALSLGRKASVATALGLGAGLGYDVGLKRLPLSWLPGWIGFIALPRLAASASPTTASIPGLTPLALGLSLAVHCSNALPDIEADTAAELHSLPVLLGRRRCGAVAASAATTTAVLAVSSRNSSAVRLSAFAMITSGITSFVVAHNKKSPVDRIAFPVMATSSAALAVAWLGTQPSHR